QFDEVDVLVAIPAGFLQQLFDGFYGRHHYPLWLDAAHGFRDDARHRSFAHALRVALAGDDEGRGAVVGARRVTCGDGAVFFEGGLELGERFERGVFARRFVFFHDDGIALFLRNLDGENLFAEEARLDRVHGFFVAVDRELILLL